MSPHYHTDGGPALEDPDLKNKWFDRWLKGADNGVENTPPVNLYPIGGDGWEHHSTLAAARRDRTRRPTWTTGNRSAFPLQQRAAGTRRRSCQHQARAHV